MIRKRAIALLGMALLVAASGFAARAHTAQAQTTSTFDQQDCADAGGWLNPDSGTCDIQS